MEILESEKKIVERLQINKNISFPNIFDKDVIIDKTVTIGFGNIICKGSILTTNLEIEILIITI